MNTKQNSIVHGDRMIKFSINFWTNNLPKKSHDKMAWESGVVHVLSNKSRGIKHDTAMFKGGDDLLLRLQELMDRQGIDLVEEEKPIKIKKVRIGGSR